MTKHPLTRGRKILINHIEDIIRKESFKKTIQALRKLYNLPENGKIASDNEAIIPSSLRNNTNNRRLKKDFLDKMNEILKPYELFNGGGRNWLLYYIIYNDNRGLVELETDVCRLYDVDDFKRILNTENALPMYPIVLTISPYASGRAISDYIKEHSHNISSLQKKHKKNNIKMGKFRKRPQQAQYDFVWSHKYLPNKEIADLLIKESHINPRLQYLYTPSRVGKMISQEKKRRQ